MFDNGQSAFGRIGRQEEKSCEARDLPKLKMPEVANRPAQIMQESQKLEKEVSVQRELIDLLAQRLSPALSINPQPEGRDTATRSDPTCPLASFMSRITEAIEIQSDVIRDLLQRLEL